MYYCIGAPRQTRRPYPYSETLTDGREPDDFQPRAQIIKVETVRPLESFQTGIFSCPLKSISILNPEI